MLPKRRESISVEYDELLQFEQYTGWPFKWKERFDRQVQAILKLFVDSVKFYLTDISNSLFSETSTLMTANTPRMLNINSLGNVSDIDLEEQMVNVLSKFFAP